VAPIRVETARRSAGRRLVRRNDLLRDLWARGLAVGTVVIITQRDLRTAERDELEALGTTRVLLKRPGVAADVIAEALAGSGVSTS